MEHDRAATAYRLWYGRLLRLYPRAYRERFGTSMAQTFDDLCRERRKSGRGLLGFALWAFAETSVAIVRESFMNLVVDHWSILRVAGATGVILTIPATMMLIERGRDVRGWNWSAFDFLVMGVLLFATGMAIEFVLKKLKRPLHRAIAVGLVVLACLAIWAQMAVGAISQMIDWVM